MIDRNQTDRLLIAALILTMFAFCFASCCPKITELSTSKTDTLLVYSTDTVTITEVDTFRTEFNVDSLLAILNGPIPINQTLSSNTNRGVTTRLLVKDGKILCEAQIDSLQHVIDSVRSSVVTVTNNVVKKVEVKKPDSWFEKLQKWFFWVVLALCLGYVIAKTQTYWIKYLPIK
jgi:hypothetical protein